MDTLKSLLAWLVNLFKSNKSFTGLLEDPRTDAEKRTDFLHEERSVAAVENPFSNTEIDETPYAYYNQNQTYSCVAHGIGFALSIERLNDTGNWQMISPIFDYRLRSNYPDEGSALQDIAEAYRKVGTPLYTTLPTPQTETQANVVSITEAMKNEAAIFKGKEYYQLGTPNDIDAIAQIAQAGHGVAILLYATEEEYALSFPQILDPNLSKVSAPIRHCVCVLPKSGFMKDGKKYLTIQDSAWFGSWKIRHLSEDFVKARCFGALYWDTVAVLGTGPRPHYTFTKPLKYGIASTEVEKMQELLIAEGLLPVGLNTGLFGGRTLAGVNAFQARYANDILIPQGLTAPSGLWGNGCIAVANKLCTAS